MKSKIAEFILRQASDAAELAQRAKVLAALTQLSPQRRNELAEAVNVVCRTIAAHGGKGRVRFSLVQQGGQRAIEVSVCDLPAEGSEAASAPPEPPPSPSAPWEATVMQRVGELVDHFESSGWPVAGAVIRMAQTLPPAFSLPSEDEVADWAQMLHSNTALDALAYALRRARSLEKDLGDVRCQQQLRNELGSRSSEPEHLTMLSLVISKTKNAISILQPNGLIIGVNDAFARMTGYAPNEAVGRPLIDLLLGPNTAPGTVTDCRHALEAGDELTQDVLQYRKNSQTYWVERDLIPVRSGDGTLTQWIVIDTDITRRHETHEALRAAKETAEKNSRLKSEFLANLSHEIRTPMNAIIGMTDLALATDLNDQQQEYLQTVRNSSESLLNLLNDILDLSKIEAGKMEMEKINFDLRAVVHDSIRTLTVPADEKGLTLSAQLPDNLPRTVRGDPTKLRQVLLNLVGNAIKFTEKGSVSIAAEQEWHNDDEIALHFWVRDTGIGISAEKLDEIFQAFRQGDASTTRQFGGSGLGLTISAELVRMMHGRIWAESTPGDGSTFHFTIQMQPGAPLALPPATADSSPNPSSAATVFSFNGNTAVDDAANHLDWNSAPRVRPLQVLVADDHTANRQLVTSVLKSRGHICTEAVNGTEALDAWRRTTFDVLLMDIQMPVMDGFQATDTIRRQEAADANSRHVPIIALTAHAMAGDREKCLAAGMDAYLAKPLRPQQLVELVESVADLRLPSGDQRMPVEEPSPGEHGFDLDYALQSLDNDRELLTGQMEFFLKDTPALLANIALAIANGDAYQLQLSAHRLKGMLARYACHDAVAIALELENQGKSNQIGGAANRLQKLRPLISRLTAAIEQYMH